MLLMMMTMTKKQNKFAYANLLVMIELVYMHEWCGVQENFRKLSNILPPPCILSVSPSCVLHACAFEIKKVMKVNSDNIFSHAHVCKYEFHGETKKIQGIYILFYDDTHN